LSIRLLKIWDMEFEIWDMEFEVWDMEFRIWDMEFGVWDMEFGVWDMDCFDTGFIYCNNSVCVKRKGVLKHSWKI
jgi:hypothetical protein